MRASRSQVDDAAGPRARCKKDVGPLYAEHDQDLSEGGRRARSARIKWAVLIVLLAHLLRRAVAALGPRAGRARPGGADRPAGPPRLLLRHRDLAAGGLLPHRPADPRRRSACSSSPACRPGVVRLHLPADGLDRPVHVGRAADRGRPQRPHPLDKAPRHSREGGRKKACKARRLAARSRPRPAAPGSCTSTTRRRSPRAS